MLLLELLLRRWSTAAFLRDAVALDAGDESRREEEAAAILVVLIEEEVDREEEAIGDSEAEEEEMADRHGDDVALAATALLRLCVRCAALVVEGT